jgi:Xaa-Pro aminopeptidase
MLGDWINNDLELHSDARKYCTPVTINAGRTGACLIDAPRGALGHWLKLDSGGRIAGYCSDITRTVAIGEPPEELARVHEVVREAQGAGVAAVRPGASCEDVDRAARAVIEAAGYGERFIHRTGHGIGLEVHETPYIVGGNPTPLEPGMTFSVEPGIYLPERLGVRIEDIVAVTADGVERFNEAPRDLTVVR